MNHKYCQNFLDHAKRSATDAPKAALKKATQTLIEATGDLIGNKIADKITVKSRFNYPCSSMDSINKKEKSKKISIEITKQSNKNKTFLIINLWDSTTT